MNTDLSRWQEVNGRGCFQVQQGRYTRERACEAMHWSMIYIASDEVGRLACTMFGDDPTKGNSD
jgi:hypothetical protein